MLVGDCFYDYQQIITKGIRVSIWLEISKGFLNIFYVVFNREVFHVSYVHGTIFSRYVTFY